MNDINDVAVAYETDWTGWSIAIVAAVIVAALLWAMFADIIGAWIVDDAPLPTPLVVIGGILWVALSLAALIALFAIPGQIMRHLPVHGMVWWVVLGGVVAIAGLFWWGYIREDLSLWWTAVPAGAIGVGVAVGAAGDAITRAASAIPVSVGGFLLMIVLGVVVVWAWMSDRR